jgi:hypothetical protein
MCRLIRAEAPSAIPSNEPEVVYLLSADPLVQNLLTIFGFVTALGGAFVVVWVAIRFLVRPIRAWWRNRVQLSAAIEGSAQHSHVVSPRGLTFPKVKVVVQNLSLVRTLPNVAVSTSTLPSAVHSGQGNVEPERTLEVMLPLTEAHVRGRHTSEIIAPQNWQLVEEFSVTLSWETKRITATESKRASKTWKFKTSEVQGLRESY